MKRLLPLLLPLLLMACEREIDIDYRTANTHFVAEVEQTRWNITARIGTTQSVQEEGNTGHRYGGEATVTVRPTGSQQTDTLQRQTDGSYSLYYFSDEGKEYVVDVAIDGRHYTSTSVMHTMPVVKSFRLVWKEMMTEKMLFADLRLQDSPDEMNFYFMHLYRNGVGYRWAVMRDTQNPGGELQQLFSCTTKREMDKGTDKDVLHTGDRLRLEVRSICQRAFDYLYSLQLMDNAGTNPIANFSGGLLGYYSAYQTAQVEMVFHPDSIH